MLGKIFISMRGLGYVDLLDENLKGLVGPKSSLLWRLKIVEKISAVLRVFLGGIQIVRCLRNPGSWEQEKTHFCVGRHFSTR